MVIPFPERQERLRPLIEEAFKDVPMPPAESVVTSDIPHVRFQQERLAGKQRDELTHSTAHAIFEWDLPNEAMPYYFPYLLLATDQRTGVMGMQPYSCGISGFSLEGSPMIVFQEFFTPKQLNAIGLYVLSFALLDDEEERKDGIPRDDEHWRAYRDFWSQYVTIPDFFEA